MLKPIFLACLVLAAGAGSSSASVLYSFQQTALVPSAAAFGNSHFQLRDELLVTDAEFLAGMVSRAGDGLNMPGYQLTIGSTGLLSGTVRGYLSDYVYTLNGTNGTFSGNLIYGDRLIPECSGPGLGCTITGVYAVVPEPASILTLGFGLLGLAAVRRARSTRT